MEAKFTKGKWESRGIEKESNGYISIDYPNGTITAYGKTIRDINGNLIGGADVLIAEAEANAKLIAAAPKLFEMLNKILNIEDHAFTLKGFDVKRLKSEISTVINKVLK